MLICPLSRYTLLIYSMKQFRLKEISSEFLRRQAIYQVLSLNWQQAEYLVISTYYSALSSLSATQSFKYLTNCRQVASLLLPRDYLCPMTNSIQDRAKLSRKYLLAVTTRPVTACSFHILNPSRLGSRARLSMYCSYCPQLLTHESMYSPTSSFMAMVCRFSHMQRTYSAGLNMDLAQGFSQQRSSRKFSKNLVKQIRSLLESCLLALMYYSMLKLACFSASSWQYLAKCSCSAIRNAYSCLGLLPDIQLNKQPSSYSSSVFWAIKALKVLQTFSVKAPSEGASSEERGYVVTPGFFYDSCLRMKNSARACWERKVFVTTSVVQNIWQTKQSLFELTCPNCFTNFLSVSSQILSRYWKFLQRADQSNFAMGWVLFLPVSSSYTCSTLKQRWHRMGGAVHPSKVQTCSQDRNSTEQFSLQYPDCIGSIIQYADGKFTNIYNGGVVMWNQLKLDIFSGVIQR